MINGKIILCQGINLDSDMINVLDYTEEQMIALCTSKQVASANNYSFIDESKGIIYCSFPYDTCLKSNYIAFQNPNYSNKWFFAFVSDVVYKGDRNTEIHFKVDSWSTWFKSLTIKPSFVIREHTNNDTIGSNIIDEGLSVGELVSDNVETITLFDDGFYVAVLTNYLPDNVAGSFRTFAGINIFTNSVFGSKILLFPFTEFSSAEIDVLSAFIHRAGVDAKPDDIRDMFIMPFDVVPANSVDAFQFEDQGSLYNAQILKVTSTVAFNTFVRNQTYTKKYTFPNFVPRNNKVYCYPYNYLYITNNSGDYNTFKFEDFSDANCTFRNEFCFGIGGNGRLVPTNYKGIERNNDESISLSKLPTCQWSSDSYTNWLTQNAVNLQNNGFIATSNALGSLATGDVGGAISTALSYQMNLNSQLYSANLLPQKVAGSNQGDLTFATNSSNYKLMRMHPKIQFLRQIDDYFTRFGYKTNRLKIPNITGRRNFNYIEIGSSDELGSGNVPNKYIEEINSLARRGVTIWHNHENVGNYLVQNDII